MAKKPIKSKQPIKTPAKPAKKNDVGGNLVSILILAVVTLLCFSNAFTNDFTNWDDPAYVINNSLVQSLAFDNIKEIFTSFSMGNYHPFSMLSLAIDYHFFQLNPHGYHATSIIIHVLNVILVFLFIRMLSGSILAAFITSLLFGIHPMHVESVSWVAERKDVLYLFFFMAALCFYMSYLRTKTRKAFFYVLTIVLFIFSLLSKAQAVTLPVVLLLIDYFNGRKFDRKVWLDKIPFFLLSLGFGILAVVAQKESGAITDIPTFPLIDRIFFASFSFLNYIVKMALPVNLSAYYPYPIKDTGPFPVMYYVSPLIAIGLTATILWVLRKNKALFFGFGFYLVNIFLLLQLLPVGGSMMSERYTYLCYIGLFFIVGYFFYESWYSKNKKLSGYRYLFGTLLAGYIFFNAYQTLQRNKVWKNSEALWTNVIKQFKTVVIAFNNRGSYFQKAGKLDLALVDFNEALRLKPDHRETLINRSDVYRVTGKLDLSVADCNKALEQGFSAGAMMNRGIAFCIQNRLDDAMRDFNTVIQNEPENSNVYCNRGNLYDMRGMLDSAIEDYSKAILLKRDYSDAYYNRGQTHMRLKNYDKAIENFNSAVEYKTENPNVYYSRSLALKEKKQYSKALEDAFMAQQMGKQVDQNYIGELQELAK